MCKNVASAHGGTAHRVRPHPRASAPCSVLEKKKYRADAQPAQSPPTYRPRLALRLDPPPVRRVCPRALTSLAPVNLAAVLRQLSSGSSGSRVIGRTPRGSATRTEHSPAPGVWVREAVRVRTRSRAVHSEHRVKTPRAQWNGA